MNWKELFFRLLEECLGVITDQSEFAGALKNSRPGVRRRFSRRLGIQMLLDGASIADVRESRDMIENAQIDDRQAALIWTEYQAWRER